MEQGSTVSKIIPAPVGGWNARDPLHAMAENEAIELINFFPNVSNVVNRGGSVEFGDIAGGCVGALSCHALPSGTTNPTHDLIVNANMGSGVFKLYRIHGTTGAATDITGGLTYQAGAFIGCIFLGSLFIVDGLSGAYRVPKLTGNAVNCSWAGVVNGTLNNVFPYKGRLYYTKDTSVWYSVLGEITGTLTEFDFGSQLTLGGELLAGGSATRSGVTSNLCVVVSQYGEVLIYQGDYPGADTWAMVGHYYIGVPTGRRCLFYKGSDLHIITNAGIVPVKNLLNQVIDESGAYVTITDKIQDGFVSGVYSNPPVASTKDWNAVSNTYHKSLIVSGAKNGGNYEQIVQNTVTGAWTKYSGINTSAWASYDQYLYWCSASTGKIYQLGLPGSDTNVDLTTAFQMSCRQAFNFLGNPTLNKHITGGKLYFDLNQKSGHSTTTREVQAGVDSDFGDADDIDDVILGAVATDGLTHYKQHIDLRGEGNAISLITKARFSGGYELAWNLSSLEYEEGGTLS